MSSFDTSPSAVLLQSVRPEDYEIGAGSESCLPSPPSQAPAWVELTDVGDITAHQSSFNKSPFDTAQTIVSL